MVIYMEDLSGRGIAASGLQDDPERRENLLEAVRRRAIEGLDILPLAGR